jgi:fimbrial chaperone protein
MGTRRDKFSSLVVTGPGGKVLGENKGLVGYVLSRSSMQWKFPAGDLKPGDKLTVTAQGEGGKVQAVVPVEAHN